MRMRWVVLSLTAIAAGGSAAEIVDSGVVPVVTLRDTGYLLGDVLEERVEMQLPTGFTLDAASLPAPGRVAPWLEVRSAQAQAGRSAGLVSVTVNYQIFAEVEQASRVPIPPFNLRIEGGGQARRVAVPEKSFLLSPALPSTLSDQDRELKPSPVPPPLPVTGALVALATSVLAALSAAAYLLWAHDLLPFLPRAPGPFARLWRRWRRRAGARWMGRDRRTFDSAERLTLLREWHLALNAAAGQTLYASTLQRLFDRAPHLLPLRAQIDALFRRSWQSFYGTAPFVEDLTPEIMGLLREAAQRERGVPC